LSYGGKTLIVERSGSRQKEYYIKLKDSLSMAFDVRWLNECTYTLVPAKETFEKYPKLPKNGLLTVEITQTTSDSYTGKVSSNFSDTSVVYKFIKIR
jgi:hypothetical protein